MSMCSCAVRVTIFSTGSKNFDQFQFYGVILSFLCALDISCQMFLFTGHRSLSRDLEAQVALVTENEELREALHEVKLTH